VQAFAIGPHVGVQFHPEVDDTQLKEWLASDDIDVRDFGLDVDALVEQTARETPAARGRAQELVDLFLRRAG
jgi:GMP synthase-like glutamine amidotransferase